MKNKTEFSIFIAVLIVHIFLSIFIQNILNPIGFEPHNFFILELMGKNWDVPSGLLFLLDIGNIILLWFVSKRIFVSRFSLIPSIIYAISPWSSYLVAAHSFYIYLSFLLLLSFYGLLVINAGYKLWAIVLTAVATVMVLYSSLLLFMIMPLLFILMIVFKIINFSKINYLFILIIILALPLLFYIYVNRPVFNNVFKSEINTFSDPGLLNMVNSYRGAAKNQGLSNLAKIAENRYLFSAEYLLLKYTKQFVPPTFFTAQEKLLNFSFSPPIFLGFLIPFILGFYQILKSSKLRKVFLLSTLLVIPSIFAKSMVDLNRLFIFMPVIILVITFGLILLFEQKKKKTIAIFLTITIFLVIFQILTTISDIQLREKDRFIKYYGQNFEIGKQ